jgi:hypothetical protein
MGGFSTRFNLFKPGVRQCSPPDAAGVELWRKNTLPKEKNGTKSVDLDRNFNIFIEMG